jgi:hypothetical protein
MKKTVEAIKAVEDAGISLDALSATALFNGRQSAEAGKKDPGAVAPFTIDVGDHAVSAGFKDKATIAYASSNGAIKLKLSKIKLLHLLKLQNSKLFTEREFLKLAKLLILALNLKFLKNLDHGTHSTKPRLDKVKKILKITSKKIQKSPRKLKF